MGIRCGQPVSHRQPRWQASEQMAESFSGDNVRMQARTFWLRAPFSCSQPLVLVVHAALAYAVKFIMITSSKVRFFGGARYNCKMF